MYNIVMFGWVRKVSGVWFGFFEEEGVVVACLFCSLEVGVEIRDGRICLRFLVSNSSI